MQEHTKEIIKHTIEMDVTVPKHVRETIICVLDDKPIPNAPKPLDRILSRSQVAAVFGCSVQMVDYYARNGYLQPASITGKQSQGYLESDIRHALESGTMQAREWRAKNKERRQRKRTGSKKSARK